jgi:hypothetical protein
MTITVGGSVITFNDGTTQSTAAVYTPPVGNVGSYAWLGIPSSTTITAGQTTAGSSLVYCGTLSVNNFSDNTAASFSTVTASGTWQAMGQATNTNRYAATLWLRIS